MKWMSYLPFIALVLSTAALPLVAGDSNMADVESAERIGQLIFEKDRAAWMATDVLFAETDGGRNIELLGWVTARNDTGWLVRFLGGKLENPCTLFEVPVSDTAGKLRRFKECQPLEEGLVSMFRARQAAMSALTQPCTANHNTVVVPATLVNEAGWLVYLLAATTVPGEIVVGGHFRARVSSDGRTVNEFDPLSNSCLTLPAPAEEKPVAAVVTHVISDIPTEIHVFLSLSHEKPIYIMTEEAMWSADDGDIRLLMDGADWEAYKKRAQAQAKSSGN